MERYICIHGHFYQPPRENPWLEAIELQDSAYPFHDWNERISAECYRANAASRIVSNQNRILQIVNNYARISFNFGPTLLSWMEAKDPDTYQAILQADRESKNIFSGHGSAMAQVYNHMIMPLANQRDKYTQVVWGIRDFESRFGRMPEGMWLPETAADVPSLETLAECGIKFTILSHYQAARVRRIGEEHWHEAIGGNIDPTTAYVQHLPSGRSIAIFFYDGPISQAVAFEQLLAQGEKLAHRLAGAFSDERHWPQMVHIATDGETYGHHHRFGNMALAYALHYIESHHLARLTNYGEYLERHPPTHEVQILENTSWSCYHGIERWRSGRGSNTGLNPNWNQEWRAPLREAMDWLRDAITPVYAEHARRFLKDPWEARNNYISVVLNRTPENVDQFLHSHSHLAHLSNHDKATILKLMELQRHAMLMYTSCGWFFDDLAGIETIQIIEYAGRVLQLGRELFGMHLEDTYLDILGRAHSNRPEEGNGRTIYERYVKPSIVDLMHVGAHYAISSVFEAYPKSASIFSYTVAREDYHFFESGRSKLVVGKAWVTSDITWESVQITYGALHLGDQNLRCGVREFQGEEHYQALAREAREHMSRGDMPATIRLLDHHFRDITYSLKALFRDEQRLILNTVLDSTLAHAEKIYRQLYDHNVALMRFLNDLGTPTPKAFHTAAEFALNSYLRQAFEAETLDLERIGLLLEEVSQEHVVLDTATLGFTLSHNIERSMERFLAKPDHMHILEQLEASFDLVRRLPFDVDLWKSQNIYFEMLQNVYPRFREQASHGNDFAHNWLHHFRSLGDKLGVAMDQIPW
jgi:alpha-amylase/alpha-mannosidase (GH57 family)